MGIRIAMEPRQKDNRTERHASLRRHGPLIAALSAFAIACAPPRKPSGDPHEEGCAESAKLTREIEQRLRMRRSCWDGFQSLSSSEASSAIQAAARGDARLLAETPRMRSPEKIIRTAEEALLFLRTEGAREIPVLRYVHSVEEAGSPSQLDLLRAIYSGTGIEQLIDRSPPYFVEVHFASGFESAEEVSFAGKYFQGTNLLVINPKGVLRHEVSQAHVASHELLHYLSWLGHGGIYYYMGKDPKGDFLSMDSSIWLEEGLAGLIAYRISAEAWEKVPYPHFTASSLILEKAAGGGAVISALLTGDLRPIQRRMEAILGGLSFYEMVNGSLNLGPAYAPAMKAGRDDVRFLDEVHKDRIIRKICESPPRDFDCSL